MTEAQAQEILEFFKKETETNIGGMVMVGITMLLILVWCGLVIYTHAKKAKWYKEWKHTLTDEQLKAVKESHKFD